VAIPSGLFGPFDLTAQVIDARIPFSLPGAYLLGPAEPLNPGAVIPRYAGRSDDDVAARLKRHVGAYPKFLYDTFPTALLAFEKECGLYHTFNPPDNIVHPARPQGTRLKCPWPGCTALFY